MATFTDNQKKQLMANHKKNLKQDKDLKPLFKLMNHMGSESWYITELDELGYYYGLFHSNTMLEYSRMTLQEMESYCKHPDYTLKKFPLHHKLNKTIQQIHEMIVNDLPYI